MEPRGDRNPPPVDDELGTYYRLATVNRWLFDLDQSEGDRVATILDAVKENVWANNQQEGAPAFISFTDRYGSDVRICVTHVEVFYHSTPETRALERENEAREQRWKKAHKDWEDE